VLALSSVLSVGLVNDFGLPVALASVASLGGLLGFINGLYVTLAKIAAITSKPGSCDGPISPSEPRE
jgi:ribose/xylose/arabinose/galactoside ABC-type transport system permease subunit